jgi:hypothetical protein
MRFWVRAEDSPKVADIKASALSPAQEAERNADKKSKKDAAKAIRLEIKEDTLL